MEMLFQCYLTFLRKKSVDFSHRMSHNKHTKCRIKSNRLKINQNRRNYGNSSLILDSLELLSEKPTALAVGSSHCVGCAHFSPLVRKPRFKDLQEFGAEIARLKDVFGDELERFALMGGEPLLHPDIIAFLEMSK